MCECDRICSENMARFFRDTALQSWLLCVMKERHRSMCHIFAFCFFFFLETKSLRDDEILQHLLPGTIATIYFRDLGPQIGWTKVRNRHWFYRETQNTILFFPIFNFKIRIKRRQVSTSIFAVFQKAQN